MHQPTDTHRTTKDLSSEELKAYRQRLDQHFQNRKVDEALLQHAWHTAHRIAAMLYKDFGATQVAIFGSLTERESFTKWSDIDIAVWGLSGDTCTDAVWETGKFGSGFKIDLINFSDTKGRFRERIQSQAVPIQNAKTSVNQGVAPPLVKSEAVSESRKCKLHQRIAEDLTDIEQIVLKVTQDLQRVDPLSVDYEDVCKAVIGRHLFRFYARLEKVFMRITREIDMDVLKGRGTHKDLLAQMAEARPLRPPLISQRSVIDLVPFLRFRYRFEYLYHFELTLKETVENAKRVRAVFDSLSEELNVFIAYLEKEKMTEQIQL